MDSAAVERLSDSPIRFTALETAQRKHDRILFVICPTGHYCREDRCQSFFDPALVPTMRPPLEECEAGGAITSSGSRFSVIDAPALNLSEQSLLDRITEFNPDLMVLSVTFGSLADDLRWLTRIKRRHPKVPIGLRGAPCYVSPRELLRDNPEVDFCVHGDYELVFRQIIEFGLDKAMGVTYRGAASEIYTSSSPRVDDLDLFPLPDRSGIRPELYRVRGLGKTQATIRVQRGCPFPCTYCLVHAVSGKRARHRSPQSVVQEMKALINEGTRYFYLRAETFTLDKAWTLSLLRQISAECPEARWVTTTRVECVDDEILAAMKKAGCYGISFGLDVASEAIAAQVRKPVRKNEAIEAMRLCSKHGIISLIYVMIGFVWETVDSLAEVSALINDVRPDLVTIHFAHPYPGTVYHRQVKGDRPTLTLVSTRAQAEPAIELKGLDSARLRLFAKQELRRHYRRPAVLLSLASKIARHVFSVTVHRVK